MNLDEFVDQYGNCPVSFKGVGITTANDRPIAKNQQIVIEAYRDVHNMSYVGLVGATFGDIIPLKDLTFNQAALIILKGTEILQKKEATGVSIPPNERPILPFQTLRLHRLKDERGSRLINTRATEILGSDSGCKLNDLTRGQAEKIINAVVLTPKAKRWQHGKNF